MIGMLKSALGISKLTLPLMLLLGVVFVMSAAAAWMREDGIRDCTVQWELKLASETLSLKNRVLAAQQEHAALLGKLREAEDKLTEVQNANATTLAKQKEDFPLSADCSKCRIPNERIWVRPDKGDSKQSRISGKPGT